ncbi:MAG: amidohydrolase family protein [Planctomycetia bacterium]
MIRRPSRREFVSAVAVGVLPRSAAAEDAALPIIDTHQHLWDLQVFRLPWTAGAPALAKTFSMADYKDAVAGLNVVQTVYMEVDVAPEQQEAEVDYVVDLCRRPDNPMTAAVVSGRPASPQFQAYVDRLKKHAAVKGIRQVLHGAQTPPGYCLEPAFVAGVKLLGANGLSFDLCMRAEELADAVKLVDACPETRFVLDHCGNARVGTPDLGPWRKTMAEMARRPNVVCKVSGVVASAPKGAWTPKDLAPIVLPTLDAFGPERVMFGGDWPVCTLAASFKEWVDALKSLTADRSQEDRRKLFHDNAAAFYKLPKAKAV